MTLHLAEGSAAKRNWSNSACTLQLDKPHWIASRAPGSVGHDDARRIHRQVAGIRAEGALGVAVALHRPVPAARRADADGRRPDRRVVLLRARRAEGHRRRRLGRRVEARLLRVGVQGPPRRSRRGVQPVASVRARAGEPAAADRLRHGAVPHPHQLDQQREPGRTSSRSTIWPTERPATSSSGRCRSRSGCGPAKHARG